MFLPTPSIWDNLLVYVRFGYIFFIRIVTKHFLLYDIYCIIIILWIITTIWKVIRISYRKYITAHCSVFIVA